MQGLIGFAGLGVCLLGMALMAYQRRSRGRSLYWTYRYLGTTPAQEKVIRAALVELREASEAFTQDIQDGRPEFADLFRGESLREEALDGWFEDRRRSLAAMQPAVVATTRRIHATLDLAQRRKLSRLIEKGVEPWSAVAVGPRHRPRLFQQPGHAW